MHYCGADDIAVFKANNKSIKSVWNFSSTALVRTILKELM